MAEHDADRGDPEEKGVPVGEPLDGARGEGLGDALTESAGERLEESPGDARGESSGDEQSVPFDEEAAWKSIVEGYGEEPPDPPGSRPFRSVEDLALPEPGPDTDSGTGGGNSGSTGDGEGDDAPAPGAGSEPEASTGDLPSPGDLPSVVKPLGSSIAFAPGVGGPRDYRAPEPSEGDFDEDDEGHFVPPEPPPLPAADTTAKFAWLGVLGGPALLLLAVLFGWDMTWWLTTLGIGGFLGGFATLVTRMKDDDEDHEDPGRGAVV
ncbi:hypothetical protein [Streptomyces sp. NBC_00151]|uniref:hypothetical protein n=1 Tax=Streptomyces sp. NBC_00151 TaxID=2975669 RepID=UPI002DDBB1E6|nr:hypothetical protein [Streptomyces sp. NBC_00151]WRZ42284.1 hypothetical protein OG915_32150 [Streptomyces sp. NBC_00151]